MAKLAEVGFTQSYTYFTWRNEQLGARGVPHRARPRPEGRLHAAELLAQHARHPRRDRCATVRRPRSGCGSCWRRRWPQLRHLQGLRALRERAGVRRQRGVPALGEVRDEARATWDRPGLAGAVHQPRSTTSAAATERLRELRTITFHDADNDEHHRVLEDVGPADAAAPMSCSCVVNLDPTSWQEATLTLDLGALGCRCRHVRGARRAHRPELHVERPRPYVRLDPAEQPGHVFAGPLSLMGGPIDFSDSRWYQRAVFYEVLVRGFYDCDRRRHRRPQRADREARLPRVARRRLPLAAALLPVALARRRLRHQRLLHGAAGVRRRGRRRDR